MTCSYACRVYILHRKKWLDLNKITGHHIKRVDFLLQEKGVGYHLLDTDPQENP